MGLEHPILRIINFVEIILSKNWEYYEGQVHIQSFQSVAYTGEILNGRNIIASFNPLLKKRILLAAHWDTRHIADQDAERIQDPIDGANDGASGVCVLLEIARVIFSSPEKPHIGIDIILFDLEDYGAPSDHLQKRSDQITFCLGSQYWYKNKHVSTYHAYYGILLDMVGGKNTKFMLEDISMQYAANLTKKVWNIAEQLGYGRFFLRQKTTMLIDDHLFMNRAGIPSINIIGLIPLNGKGTFSPTWHTHQDIIENIDKDLLQAVGQTLLQVLYSE